MIAIFIYMAVGMIVGYLLRRHKELQHIISRLNIYIIYLLLFFMGWQVGNNETIIHNIAQMGGIAIVIAIASMAGSSLCTWMACLSWKKDDSTYERNDSLHYLFSNIVKSAIILLWFAIGVTFALCNVLPQTIDANIVSTYILYIMMASIGILLGLDIKQLIAPLQQYGYSILFIPIASIIGTLLFAAGTAFILPLSLKECVAIGAGQGYYSLSAVMLNELAGNNIGTMALMSNLARELSALIIIPLMGRQPFAAIATGGATTIDTTLPIITASAGNSYATISIFHGAICTFSVPLVINILYFV